MNPTSPKSKPSKFKTPFWRASLLDDWRLLSTVLVIGIAFAAIGIRILSLTFGSTGDALGKQDQQRGTIIDIEGTPLAFSEPRYNIYYNPKKSKLDEGQVASISEVLGERINTAQIYENLKKNQTFLLTRYLEKNHTDSLVQLNLPGVLVDKVSFRTYPYGPLLSQTLGFVGHEGNGLYGLEFKYNDYLNYKNEPGYEKTLVLNLKVDFQKKIEELIRNAVKENQADYGSILVQEISTGRLLGLANYPDFNLNSFNEHSSAIYLNRAVSYLLEPGSIFKIFFVAYLIERFNLALDEKNYNCVGYYELSNGEIIKCHGVHGKISLQDIIKYSCNSGIIEATTKISAEEMFSFLKRLHIEENHKVDLPGESRGLILNFKDWGIRTKATIPLGHGLAITPLQLINIFSAFIGKGYLYQPQMVRFKNQYQNGKLIHQEEVVPAIINKIVSEDVSRKATDLLYYGTIKGSTGYSSRSTGFDQVFGKTATSQLVNISGGGYYTNRYHSMFAGGYPLQDPQYSILVVVSRPKLEYYGGKVAAPIYAQVIEALNIHYQLTEERNPEIMGALLSQEAPNDEYLEEFLSSQVPDFTGLSTRKAVILLEDFKKIQKQRNVKIRYRLKGGGHVVEQSPSAGSPVKKDLTISLSLK